MALLIASRLLAFLPLLRSEQAPAVDMEQDDLAMMQSRQQQPIPQAWDKFKANMQNKFKTGQKQAFDKKLGIVPPPLPNGGEADALGLLTLTYGFPTQPGDVDDKRSFCTTNEMYECKDGFTIVKAEVQGLEFAAAQAATITDALNVSFTNALRALLKDTRVRAITANCGFFTNYAGLVNEFAKKLVKEEGLKPKPIVLGTLALAPLLTHQTGEGDGEVKGWGLLQEGERAVVVTANSGTLTKNFYDLMSKNGFADPKLENLFGKKMTPDRLQKIKAFFSKTFHIDIEDDAKLYDQIMSFLVSASQFAGFRGGLNFLKNSGKHFRTYGAQSVEGFGQALKYGWAHNVSLAGPHMNDWVLDTLFHIERSSRAAGKTKGAFFLFECTELPAYANGVRMATRMPVWDITTLAKCLMAASSSYEPSVDILENKDFKACLLSWTNPYRFEERFGKQTDDSLVGYGGLDDPFRPLELFDWGVFGKPKGERCTKEVGCKWGVREYDGAIV